MDRTKINKTKGINLDLLKKRTNKRNDTKLILNLNPTIIKDYFVAKPFVINSSELPEKICINVNADENHNPHNLRKEFKDLVWRKFKTKRRPRDPFADACHEINSMLNIKDYKRVYSKKIVENRLFINGLLVYDRLRQHYSGVSVSRNCFKKKFITKLNRASGEIPEMASYQSNLGPEERLQNVKDFYDEQESDAMMFDVEMEEQQPEERPATPEQEFGPESFETPPDQRLIAVDLSYTNMQHRYQTAFYEKDRTGKATLFECPEPDSSNASNGMEIDRSALKRIDLMSNEIPSTSATKTGKKGQSRINDLDVFGIKKYPKRRLFGESQSQPQPQPKPEKDEGCKPLGNADDQVFVRPVFSPREYSQFRKRSQSQIQSSTPEIPPQTKFLKVDEVDELVALKAIVRVPTPKQQNFVPLIQYKR